MICPHVFTGSERLRWIYADISPHCSCMSFPALDNCRNYSKQLSFFLTVISELYFTVLPLMAARLLSPESTRCLAAVGYPQSSLTFIMWHVRVYITAPLPNIPTGRWDCRFSFSFLIFSDKSGMSSTSCGHVHVQNTAANVQIVPVAVRQINQTYLSYVLFCSVSSQGEVLLLKLWFLFHNSGDIKVNMKSKLSHLLA